MAKDIRECTESHEETLEAAAIVRLTDECRHGPSGVRPESMILGDERACPCYECYTLSDECSRQNRGTFERGDWKTYSLLPSPLPCRTGPHISLLSLAVVAIERCGDSTCVFNTDTAPVKLKKGGESERRVHGGDDKMTHPFVWTVPPVASDHLQGSQEVRSWGIKIALTSPKLLF
jgi:hypothetical protein